MIKFNLRLAFLYSFLSLFILISNQLPLMAQYGTQTPQLFDGTSGTVKGYLENLPDDWTTNPTAKYPVLIFFHGSGEVGNGVPYQINQLLAHGPPQLISNGTWPSTFTVAGKNFKFLVISPQDAQYWQSGDIQYVVNQVLSKYANRIDPSRVYLTGLSSGGGGLEDYLAASPSNGNLIAGAAILCGASYWGNSSRINNIVQAKVPIWFFHNELDPTVPSIQSIQWTENLNTAGISPTAKLTIFPGVASHDCWDAVYDPSFANPNKVYEWLLSNSKGATTLPPISNAGAGQSIVLPASAILDGTASKAVSGSIVNYQWSKVQGYAGDIIQNPNSAKTTVTFTLPATYIYQLTVTDNYGNINSSTVTIVVNPNGSIIPTIKPGSSQSILFPNLASLDGSASFSNTGSIISYVWSKASGPVGDIILNPGQPRTQIYFNSPGTYTYILTCGDNTGLYGSGSITINVQSSSSGPVANAGGNQTITLPTTGILDGTASTDQGGTISTYAWAKVSGPSGDIISNANIAKTSVSFTQSGTYVYQLTIKDNTGASSSANVSLTVNSSAQAPIANAGGYQTISIPATANLDGSASKANGGASLVSYNWVKTSGPTGDIILNSKALSTTASFTQGGTYVYQVTVVDNNGLSNSASTIITVNNPLNPPIANAGSNQTLTLPSTGILNGTGSTDPSGTINSYLWSKTSGPSGDIIANPSTANTTVSFSQSGTYVYNLLVKDNNNLSSNASITIIVNAAPIPPIANAGANQTINLPASGTLDGTASTDASGTINSYLWTKISGPAGDIIGNSSLNKTSVSFTQAGTYIYQLTVKDNNSLSSTAQVTITVNSTTSQNLTKTFINFGDDSHMAPSPWNNTGWKINTGTIIPLMDQYGANAGSISANKSFSGASNIGFSTGNNSGIFPDLVMQSGFEYSNSDTISLKITGLNTQLLYNFSFFASWANPWSGAIAYYKIGNTQVSLNAANNSSNLAIIKGVSPDNSGTILIKIVKDSQSAFAWLNALEMDSYSAASSGPSAPTLISAHGNTKNSIGLSWSSNPNTNEYYIYRSNSSSGPYTLIDSVNSSQLTYLNTGLSSNTGYYYQLMAGNSNGKSSPGNIKYALTLQNSVDISFNADQPASPPWNDLNGGTKLSGLINVDGTSSSLGVNILRNFTGTNTLGSVTWTNSGIFPDKVIRGQYYINAGDSAIVQLTGLNQSNSYDLVFFNSWGSPWTSGITDFTIGNQMVSSDPSNNSTSTVQINNIIPDINGNIMFSVKAHTGARYGLINALVLQIHGQAPNAPNSTLSFTKINPAGFSNNISPLINSSNIHLYPNPFQEELQIGIESQTSGHYQISIFDMQGNLIYSEKNQGLLSGFNWRKLEFSTSHLNAGIYLLKIQSDTFKDQVFRIQKL